MIDGQNLSEQHVLKFQSKLQGYFFKLAQKQQE